MNPAELDRQLAKGVVQPLYLLHAKEPYLADRAAEKIKALVLPDETSLSMSFVRLEGSEVTGAELLDHVRTMPMLSDRRFVLVKNAEKMKADEQERLIPYVSDPSPTTVLVLQGPLDMNRKLGRALKKANAVVRFDEIKDRDVAGWVQQEARARNMEMDPKAAYILGDLVGNDLGRLNDLLEQLDLYKGGQGRIAEEDVFMMGSDVRGATVFMLNDAIAAGNRNATLDNLRRLLDAGTAPFVILAMLARQMRHALMAHEVRRSGGSPQDVTQALKAHPFVAKKAQALAQAMGKDALIQAQTLITHADRALKSSPLKDKLLIERLALALVGLVSRR